MELITPCQDVQNASVLLRVYGMQCRCEHCCAGALQLRVPRGAGAGAGAGGVSGLSRSAQAANTASFSKTVELNEVGFKFVRKCINAVETKGEELTWPGRASHGLELRCSSCSTVLVTNTGLQLRAEECVFFSLHACSSGAEIPRGRECCNKSVGVVFPPLC